MQHIVSKLSAHGSAGVVMANGTMTSQSTGEGEIRKNMVEDDVVSCVLALSAQIFCGTGIPACVGFFDKDKSAGRKGSIDRRGEVLLIDARQLGHMVDCTERAFSNDDIHLIANAFRSWRGRESTEGEYEA